METLIIIIIVVTIVIFALVKGGQKLETRDVSTAQSPYLKDSRRLAEVLAAIQILGAYSFASLKAPVWAEKLGTPVSGDDWMSIFNEHPEFFRINGDWVSLRMRHGFDRIFSHELGRDLTKEEVKSRTEDERENLTRRPLESDQIELLMKTAIELHARGVAHSQESRWMTPLLFALLGVVVGAILQAALK